MLSQPGDFPPNLPAGHPVLKPGDVHLWHIDLGLDPEVLQSLESTLDTAEVERARRFRFPVHRRRFVARRAALRAVLSGYTGEAPAQIRYTISAHGKLSLRPGHAGTTPDGPIEFNASHSSDMGLIAVARARVVGVDIERENPAGADPGVARRFFSAPEVRDLESLDQHARVPGFFRCWTGKEAYVKATGEGLSMPLDAFRVSLVPQVPARLQAIDERAGDTDQWELTTPAVAKGYRAALVVHKPLLAVHDFHWQPGTHGPYAEIGESGP